MLDQITGMQVFAKVAAVGGLSRAARALGMSQTMATKHVGALEQRLGPIPPWDRHLNLPA